MEGRMLLGAETVRRSWGENELPGELLDVLDNAVGFSARVCAPQSIEAHGEASSVLESEMKVSFGDGWSRVRKLLALDYRGCALESNVMWDEPNGGLAALDARLRTRTKVDVTGASGETSVLTVKRRTRDAGPVKRELELEIKNVGAIEMKALVAALGEAGYRRISSYERFRHTFDGVFQGTPVEVVVDLFPDIGRFIEIEGPGTVIDALAREFDAKRLLTDPYDTIHADWCVAQGRREEDHIAFAASERERVREEEARWWDSISRGDGSLSHLEA